MPAAECRAKCGAYPAVEHGQVSPAVPVWADTVVSIACKPGYVLVEGSPTSATCIDTGAGGDYDAFGAACIAVCTPFPLVEHGTVSPGGEVRAGDMINVVCDPGYKFYDNSAAFEAVCVDSGLGGEYSKGPPVCVEAPVYCAAVHIENAMVSPDADVLEGEGVTVTCNEGFEFDADVATPFTATCVKDENGGETINGYDYLGIFDAEMPVCVPIPPPDDDEEEVSTGGSADGGGGSYVEMYASLKGLNMECSKWRNNKDGVGNGNNLSLKDQLAQMAYCMQQDCAQSMEGIACRYTDENRLCYTDPGQIFCQDNAPHPNCQDLGEQAGDPTNLDGDGAWAPKQDVPVFGSAALTAAAPTYACNCLKNCAHYTGSSALKKYRCTGGNAIMVGQIAGSAAEDIERIASSTKNGQCACSCGIINDKASWEEGDSQK